MQPIAMPHSEPYQTPAEPETIFSLKHAFLILPTWSQFQAVTRLARYIKVFRFNGRMYDLRGQR